MDILSQFKKLLGIESNQTKQVVQSQKPAQSQAPTTFAPGVPNPVWNPNNPSPYFYQGSARYNVSNDIGPYIYKPTTSFIDANGEGQAQKQYLPWQRPTIQQPSLPTIASKVNWK